MDAREEVRYYGTEWVLIAAAAVAVAAAGVSTYSAVKQANYQADVAEAEGKQREIEAEDFRQRAMVEERKQRRQAQFLLGKQEAITAAAGIDPTQGSPIYMELDSIRQAEVEALNIRRTGVVGSYLKDFEARLQKSNAGYYRSTTGPTIASGVLSAASGALSPYTSSSSYNKPKTIKPIRSPYNGGGGYGGYDAP